MAGTVGVKEPTTHGLLSRPPLSAR